MVKYEYNAWGEHTVTDTSGISLGTKNPFRYRSYFYDTETKLYFLKTRYYDPEIGRFINMDSIDYADPESINGLNLYAYCGNNPVMGYDPDGTIDFGKIFAASVIVIGASLLIALTAGSAAIAIAGALGFSANMVAVIGSTVTLTALGSGMCTGFGELYNQIADKKSENINLGSVFVSTAGVHLMVHL